jgi:iron(III) transport system ATP-binding protein
MDERQSSVDGKPVSGWGERGTVGPVFAGEIDWENISYAINGRTILNNISFGLKAGEIACLLGPSGCGKSTLLRIAAGITSQTSGRIVLDGQEVAGPRIFLPPEKRSIGMMFQDFALFPHLTVLHNVMFGLYAVSKSEARRTAQQALERVGLLRYADVYPHFLSGGEQQRVALARTLVPRPQVILMDEPFSGLDPQLRWTIRSETMALLRETRATALIVTHDPDEALDIADRIILMNGGQVAQTGSADEIFRHPASPEVARFFSIQNECESVVIGGHVSTPLGKFSVTGFADGTIAQVMVRPQALGREGGSNAAPASVVAVQRKGEYCEVKLQFEGQPAPWTAKLPADDPAKPGDNIFVSCRAKDVVVFKKTDPHPK